MKRNFDELIAANIIDGLMVVLKGVEHFRYHPRPRPTNIREHILMMRASIYRARLTNFELILHFG